MDEHKREEALRHLRHGLALDRANRTAEAVEQFRQAIVSYPQLYEAHNALGVYYQRHGMLAKAADSFRTVTALEGDFLAYFNLGYVLVELERYEEALDAFQHCLSLSPEDSATHFEIGYIHFSRGEFDQALSHLQLPLHSYPEDWEVHNLIGKCLLGLRRYDEALNAFGRSLLLTTAPSAQAELLDNIVAVQRHREFRHLSSLKDQVYAQDGVVYLGSAQDDGLNVSEVRDYHFTYPDIATTVQRLVALIKSSRWGFSAVVVADTLARPLGLAVSQLLDMPLRQPTDLSSADHALIVFAVAREAELLKLTIERLPCPATAFCLGLNWLRHSKMHPDLIGIAAHGACSVPWELELRHLRAAGASSTQVDACLHAALEALLRAVRETPIDTNLPRQVRYYTRNHRRLNVGT